MNPLPTAIIKNVERKIFVRVSEFQYHKEKIV